MQMGKQTTSFECPKKLIERIDEQKDVTQYRSQWIRNAIREKLEADE